MKEEQIRPAELFNRYLRLAEQDAERFFSDTSRFEEVPCPACAGDAGGGGFEKLGFRYLECGTCASLYVSPRPTQGQIDRYYREGEAVEFWATEFFRVTAESRRKHIFAPRAEVVAGHARDHLPESLPKRAVDIGSGYGIFLEELARLDDFEDVWAVEPSPPLAAICEEKGFRVVRKPAEDLEPGDLSASFATAFEVVEHLYDPAEFLRSVGRAVVPGGLLLFSTLTVTGFDIQVLWERSKSVYPPHHLNLMSVTGMERLVERAGYDLVSLTTPGKLDVDIVANAVQEDPSIPLPRFARTLLDMPEATRDDFQRFLASNRLSSHVQVLARRPEAA